MSKQKYNDHPLVECAKRADQLIRAGATIYQKWTCNKCGDRVTANNPNVFTTLGYHEGCGCTTNILERGCNYMVIASTYEAQKEVLKPFGESTKRKS